MDVESSANNVDKHPTSQANNQDLNETASKSNILDNANTTNVDSSPTKSIGSDGSTPTKSAKNRRKSEARKRNNQKKNNKSTCNDKVDAGEVSSEKQNPSKPMPEPIHLEGTSSREQEQASGKVEKLQMLAGARVGRKKSCNEVDGNGKVNGNPKHSNNRDENHGKNESLIKLRDRLKAIEDKNHLLVAQIKQQIAKTNDLEQTLQTASKTCSQLDRLLQQEVGNKAKLSAENESLKLTLSRLKAQVTNHEKSKLANDEMIRILNATLMERETEVSLLKLKLTRIQTNQSSSLALNSSLSSIKNDPCKLYTSGGKSNSEFERSPRIDMKMTPGTPIRLSNLSSRLSPANQDATVWASLPPELAPSKRPELVERSFRSIYEEGLDASKFKSTPLTRDRRYKTLPHSMKSPSQEFAEWKKTNLVQNESGDHLHDTSSQPLHCQVTNLDENNSVSQCNKAIQPGDDASELHNNSANEVGLPQNPTSISTLREGRSGAAQDNVKLAQDSVKGPLRLEQGMNSSTEKPKQADLLALKCQLGHGDEEGSRNSPKKQLNNPEKHSTGIDKIVGIFRFLGSAKSSQSRTDLTNTASPASKPSPFKRGANRSTCVGVIRNSNAQITPVRQIVNFQTDKPFAEWDTDMLVNWMTMIGLSMYTDQCRRWAKCGAHIMNATPAEVDKGLGITNHLHRKKLRLAISELNGDCDKVTKAAAKLDYLWVAKWLDDIGLPQYKEAFINARIDGRVLNYLTVDDLVSMNIKSLLHHASIRCGIKVLRSINFDLQQLQRRATADEIDQMNSARQRLNQVTEDANKTTTGPLAFEQSGNGVDITRWTCHRFMEWLRLIDLAEFAPNLRGSGVHGGLITYEDGFSIDTLCSLLSIPIGSTLLRRHLTAFFKGLIGVDLLKRKRLYQDSPSNVQLNPSAEVKLVKKKLWFSKLKGSKVGKDCVADEYLCPMYPIDP